ncbi:tetratricopeptide (TPR) repeat protein [Anoxybacillus calidus]|jgi:tetratricopeptide (TPR) repeat protein|uniref:Tetratricopeptide (TPR) repeat protein n=1 Tax=[Anoxybacillus] calidus TaxID=575178 RepID=A0A7W0BVP3_9BACL|nr:tetratricopeptide repeat protein [Anoxybacillus calidus]MBA2870189.1 tetratricopeptide (TPR) repeat protein [Anoxybacillus calidus]
MMQIEKLVRLVENGEIEKALALIPKVKAECSDEEKYMLAEHLFSWGLLPEARDILEELSYRYPDEGDILLFLAEVYTELDEEEKAINILAEIDENDPTYPRACLLAADLYQMQGLDEVSERKLLLAYEKLPNEPIIQFALGEFYLTKGEYQKSVEFYKKVLEKETTLAGTSIPQRLAEALSLSGQFEEALPYYEEALNEKLEIHTLFGYGFTAFQAGYYQTAIEKLKELKELDAEYIPLYLYLAKAYEHEGDLQKSYETVKEGLKVDEWNKELLLYAGKIALKLGKPDEAEEHLRAAVNVDPGYIEALLTLTKLLLHEERYEDVVACIEEAMKQGEYDPQFEWDLARAKHQLEMYSDALKHYQEAYTFFKNEVDFLEEYAYFLIEEGNRKTAKQLFEQILQIDPTHTEAAEMVLQLEEE